MALDFDDRARVTPLHETETPTTARSEEKSRSAPKRIRDLPIRDIYLGDKTGKFHIRGLSGKDITGIPDDYFEDFDILCSTVIEQAPADKIEFPIIYDGITYRVSCIPSVDEPAYHIRRPLPKVPAFKELRIPDHQARILEGLGTRNGLILVAGDMGAGKTTLASAVILHWLLKYGDIAYTLEDPFPELPLAGAYGQRARCFQEAVEDGDYARAMHNVLRRSPRYIMLGEIRSAQTASQAIQAAVRGHLVVSTIHAGSILQAIQQIVRLAASNNNDPPRPMLAAGLLAITHQTLEYNPTRTVVQFMTLSPEIGDPCRAIIRDGQIEHLTTYIERQRVTAQRAMTLAGAEAR